MDASNAELPHRRESLNGSFSPSVTVARTNEPILCSRSERQKKSAQSSLVILGREFHFCMI